MERRQQNGASPEDKAEYLLQRVLEYRQGQLEQHVAALAEAINGKDGIREQLMTQRIVTDQRLKALICVLKWLAGIGAVLLAGLCFWVVSEAWQTRDAVKHLLSRPGIAGPQTPGK